MRFTVGLSILVIGLSSVHSLYALEKCQVHLLKLLKRLPAESSRHYTGNEPVETRRLPFNDNTEPLLKPKFTVKIAERGNMDFSVIDSGAFQRLLDETRGKGFWSLYTPADPWDQNPYVGHTSTSINNVYFTGPYAMQSLGEVNARLDKKPYVVAQFFELSDDGVHKLDRFFHDRTWNYHSGNWDYRSNYHPWPFSKPQDCGENCASFAFSFLEPRFQHHLRPEMQQIANELGRISVSEVPNQQVWFNLDSPAYRGTVMVTHDPNGAIEWMTKGDFNSTDTGKQVLFDGHVQRKE